jgi:hypothetical protein
MSPSSPFFSNITDTTTITTEIATVEGEGGAEDKSEEPDLGTSFRVIHDPHPDGQGLSAPAEWYIHRLNCGEEKEREVRERQLHRHIDRRKGKHIYGYGF